MVGGPLVELSDGVVTLRAWEAGDAPAVFEACQDPLISRFVPVPVPYAIESAHEFIGRSLAAWEGDDERPFAIVDHGTGVLVGSIARYGPWGHRAQFGYWIAPPVRGLGFATRALRLITDWTLETTDLIRLDLYTHPDNDASKRVAERAGYVFEGVRKAWYIDREGKPVDAVFYALVRGDRSQVPD